MPTERVPPLPLKTPLAALEAAISAGADSAEIDVQQTQDGTLIIIHDTNFKEPPVMTVRFGIPPCDIVQTLDAGSFFAPEFANGTDTYIRNDAGAAKTVFI